MYPSYWFADCNIQKSYDCQCVLSASVTQYPGPKENWVVHDFKGPDPIPREASLLGQPLQRGWLGCTRGREREGIARKWRVFKTASIYVAITTHSCSLLRVKKQLDVHGVVLVYTHFFPEVYIISSLAKTIRPFPLFLQVGNVHGKLCCFSFHWELELKDSPSCGNAHIVVLINLF